MCGILGILNFKYDVQKYLSNFNKSLDLLSNRGPDNEGSWINNNNARLILQHK